MSFKFEMFVLLNEVITGDQVRYKGSRASKIVRNSPVQKFSI